MRRAIIGGMLVICTSFVNAQTFDEWFKQKETQIKYLIEQIAALKAYGEVINKGYDIADNGLTNISDSKNKDYQQHKGYFLSLWKVKFGIKSYSKVLAIYKMKTDIEKQYKAVKSPTEFLNDNERAYINNVFANLLNRCNDLAVELEMSIGDDQIQLKDNERIERIDKIYAEMQDRYEFSQSFTNQIKTLVVSRLMEQNEIDKLSSMYGVK